MALKYISKYLLNSLFIISACASLQAYEPPGAVKIVIKPLVEIIQDIGGDCSPKNCEYRTTIYNDGTIQEKNLAYLKLSPTKLKALTRMVNQSDYCRVSPTGTQYRPTNSDPPFQAVF